MGTIFLAIPRGVVQVIPKKQNQRHFTKARIILGCASQKLQGWRESFFFGLVSGLLYRVQEHRFKIIPILGICAPLRLGVLY